MDLEAAKLSYGKTSRYAMGAAFVCLLLTATFLIAASMKSLPGIAGPGINSTVASLLM
jgi:hypothetical protein